MEFMAKVPDKFYRLAIVDPPYGIGLDFQFKSGYGKSIHTEKDWNNHTPNKEYFDELHRISINQIIWGCNYYAKYIPAVGRIIHDKQMNFDGTRIKFSEADIASCSLQKRVTIFRYRWNGNVQGSIINWDNTGPDSRIHPTQKPIVLYRWLLQNYAKPGDNIIDTHGGSMSIAIACDMEGFDLDICEIDREYFDAGVKRFNEYKRQLTLDFNVNNFANSKVGKFKNVL